VNHNCHGDFYVVNGERFYRCLLDSTVLPDVDPSQPCPRCARAIVVIERGEVRTRTVTLVEAFYDRRWFLHSRTESPASAAALDPVEELDTS
jgi:hypothetical protein